ncbi:hypothetical protein AWE51_10040 [Aquimarina aggregata]|uniref:Uncharacterized protein n=1 Tax=Aquimarina aggregata TaxID=1642818 RepID=A0A162ZR34_9FLAO|nr:hypothetical protein [Aquimarina aggregata]KZS39971.1 hypothetical protein AWE51_10040 [Aquimarina aggregata]
MKNVIKTITLALLCLILHSCEKEETTDYQSEIAKNAKLWYKENHNLTMNENTSFNGVPDWDNHFVIQNKTYFPILKDRKNVSNKQINSNVKASTYSRPYYVLTNDGTTYEESLVVVFSKDKEDLLDSSNIKSLANIEYSFPKSDIVSEMVSYNNIKKDNRLVSFTNNGDDTTQNLQTVKGCTTYYVFETTCYSDGSCESNFLYTTQVCGGGGSGDGSGGSGGGNGNTGDGGGGSGDGQNPVLTNEGMTQQGTNCKNFKWKKIGDVKVSAMDKIRHSFSINTIGNPNLFSYHRTMTLNPMYMTMPDYVEDGFASVKASQAIDMAFLEVEHELKKLPPNFVLTPREIVAMVYKELRRQFGIQRGSINPASASGFSQPSMGIEITQHETVWFNARDCLRD